MNRVRSLLLAASFALASCISSTMHAQTTDLCMDCAERITEHVVNGQTQYESDALCCDWVCEGGYTLEDENVGWGCRVKPMTNPTAVN